MSISGITREQALDCLKSTDLIGIGMEADAVRFALHPEGVATYTVGDVTSEIDVSGLRTSARIVIGSGESPEQRVDRLFGIRKIQEEKAVFAAFALSCPRSPHNGIEAPTAVEYLRTLAVARMVLDNIENAEASCVEQGLKVAQMALRFGANDAGAIPTEGFSVFTEEDLRRVIRDAGFKPVERDAGYRTMYLGN